MITTINEWPSTTFRDGFEYRFKEAYQYFDETGKLSYEKGRFENKEAESGKLQGNDCGDKRRN